jgi:histidinol-phosphate/aromatic aminotransferase/cobyric acid decarboxylase-like protein
MKFPGAAADGGELDGLRITIGTEPEIERLLEVLPQAVEPRSG